MGGWGYFLLGEPWLNETILGAYFSPGPIWVLRALHSWDQENQILLSCSYLAKPWRQRTYRCSPRVRINSPRADFLCSEEPVGAQACVTEMCEIFHFLNLQEVGDRCFLELLKDLKNQNDVRFGPSSSTPNNLQIPVLGFGSLCLLSWRAFLSFFSLGCFCPSLIPFLFSLDPALSSYSAGGLAR